MAEPTSPCRAPRLPPEWGGGRRVGATFQGRAHRRRRHTPRRGRDGRRRRRAEPGRRRRAPARRPTLVATAAGGAPTTSTDVPPTTTTIPKTTIAQPLRKGMAGDEVQRLQERLQALGFQPGPIDGQFGDLTQMAVWAYQKLVMGVRFKDPDGVVTPDMWLALQDPLPVHARRPEAGEHTEIYLPQQVVVVFDGDTPMFISHISSGELAEPGDDFNDGQGVVRGGHDRPRRERQRDRHRADQEGRVRQRLDARRRLLVRPQGGGQAREPPRRDAQPRLLQLRHRRARRPTTCRCEPASHGCIRIPNLISPTFFNLVSIGEQVFVFDDVKEPEVYGSPSGLWDWADPNYTTTTTSTTTTTTTTDAAGRRCRRPPSRAAAGHDAAGHDHDGPRRWHRRRHRRRADAPFRRVAADPGRRPARSVRTADERVGRAAASLGSPRGSAGPSERTVPRALQRLRRPLRRPPARRRRRGSARCWPATPAPTARSSSTSAAGPGCRRGGRRLGRPGHRHRAERRHARRWRSATARPASSTAPASATRPGLADGSADVVLAVQAMHWMEPAATLAEVARILRPGGVFATVDADWPPVTGLAAAEAAWVRAARPHPGVRGPPRRRRHAARRCAVRSTTTTRRSSTTTRATRTSTA